MSKKIIFAFALLSVSTLVSAHKDGDKSISRPQSRANSPQRAHDAPIPSQQPDNVPVTRIQDPIERLEARIERMAAETSALVEANRNEINTLSGNMERIMEALGQIRRNQTAPQQIPAQQPNVIDPVVADAPLVVAPENMDAPVVGAPVVGTENGNAPAQPAVNVPVVPAIDAPAMNAPAQPAVNVPVVPAIDAPSMNAPAQPELNVPVVPAIDAPVMNAPAQPAVNVPVVPAIDAPVVAANENSVLQNLLKSLKDTQGVNVGQVIFLINRCDLQQ